MKRLTALILTLALCVGLLPAGAALAADASTTGTCGENVIWSFDAATGTLTIEGEGAMEDYDLLSDHMPPWTASGFGEVTALEIGEGVTHIGSYAFSFTALTSVTIPEGVVSIGSNAFYLCEALTAVDIASTVEVIGDSAFAICYELAEITGGEGVRDIDGEGFNFTKWWDSLSGEFVVLGKCLIGYKGAGGDVVVPDGLEGIGGNVFGDADSITSITIPDSVTNIGEYAFWGCENLTTIALPLRLESISDGLFSGCTALASVEIPETVTSIGEHAFSECSALTSIELPNGITSLGNYAFSSSGLTSFEFPPLITTISDRLLSNCRGLTAIHIPGQITAIGGSAFANCTSLTEVNGGENVTTVGGDSFAETPWLAAQSGFITFGSTLVNYVGEGGDVVIPDGVTSVSSSAFFEAHESVNSVAFPEGVEKVSSGMFNGAMDMTSVTLPASLKTIETTAFYSCNKLSDIYYGGTPDQWSEIYVARGNDEIFDAVVHFPDGTSAVASELNLPGGIVLFEFDGESGVMTVRGSAEMEDFWYRTDPGRPDCELVTELVIEDGVQSIGDYAFAGFSQIKSVTIPDSVTSIGTGAFAGCTSLETIYVGSGVIEMGFMVGFSIFSHVSDFYPAKAELIKNIYVDEDNPAFADIDGVLFDKDLSTLVYYPRGREAEQYNVPRSVTTIGAGAFNYNMWEAQYTPAIRTVSLPASATEIGEYAFGEGVTYEYREEPSAWAQTEVDEAIALGLVPHDLQRGYGSGTTREEYCRFVVELIESVSGKPVDEFLAERSVSLDDVYFTDTDAEHVRIAGALGVVQGVGEGRFDPNTALTREEAATMLARLAALFAEVDALPYVYDDAPQIASWARDAVYAMRALGVMHGDDMNLFEPRSTYIREAAILTIVRMHKALTEGVEREQQLYPMLAEVDGEYLWGCVDESGAFVIEPQYAYLDWSGDYGVAALPDAPNEYFVIDRDGGFVMAAEGHHEERIPKIIGNLLHIDMWSSELLYRLPDGEHVYGAMQKSRTGGTLNSGYVTVFDDMNKWAGMLDRDGKTVLSTDDRWTFRGTPFDNKVILGKGYPDEYYLWDNGKVTPLPGLTGSYINSNSVGDLYRVELNWLNEDFEFEYLYGLNTVYGEILPLEYAELKLTALGQAFVRKDDASPWELWSRAGKLCELPDGFAGEYIIDRIAHYAFALDGEVCIVSTEGVETARVALPDGASFEFVNGLLRITTASASVYYTPHGEETFAATIAK